MARIKKYSPEQKLSSFQTFVVDENPNSDYFRITEFKDTFTGGKNGFLIEGSEYLKETTEIKIEILDVEGNPVFYEPAKGIPEYYEGISSLIAVYVYNDTPIGLGKITILGELKEYIDNDVKRAIPDTWRGTYNVKWERTFQINKLLANEDRVRFFKRPQINIDEINKPIFNNNANLVTQNGNVNGIPLAPTAGTTLTEFSLPTSYRLNVSSGDNWTGSIGGNRISFDNIDYNPIVLDVVSETEVIVSPPYAPNGIVRGFSNESYTTSFNYLEGVTDLATALTGSFAKISITDMKTAVGDAARVKVYRRSQSNLTDYEFVQEIQLESNELLRDIETTEANEISYGTFTQDVLSQYWMTSSNNISVELNTGFLYNSAKLNSTEGNYFLTTQSFSIQSGVEYTLDFNVKKGTNISTDFIKATLSGSLNGTPKSQTILNIPSSNSVLQKQNFTENIIADNFDEAKLYFEVEGSDWYINNVSLKASQETSFSPDEITFIQQVPKTLQTETFDYRFEFYDINNNYIPVLVEDTKTFDGGNLNLFNKDITITPNNLYFSFDSASAPSNPLPPTTITFDVETTLVTGSITYTSGAYDEFGDLILSSEYVGGQYPGLMSGYETLSPTLTVADFTGSRNDITVQYIRFTGEVEGVSDDVVITRTQDGKGGVNFEIRPYRGTIIKNKDESTLEVQAIRIDGVNEIILRDNLPQNGFSDAKLRVQSGSEYILLSEADSTGYILGLSAGTTGSGELDYNAVFDRTSITGQLPLYLMDGDTEEDILTTLLLTDLQDGLGAGFVTFDVEQFNINPKEDTTFTPQTASLAGNFYLRGTNESPISGTLKVFPSMSITDALLPEYYMFFETGAFDSRITVTATNAQNEIIDSGIPGDSVGYYSPIDSKQLTFNFTYTEDFTSESISVDKTIFVAPDGIGIEPVVISLDPLTVNLNSNQQGEVYSYTPLDTTITAKQGKFDLIYTGSEEPGTFFVELVTPTNITYTSESFTNTSVNFDSWSYMDSGSLLASVDYDLKIYPYYTSSFELKTITQRITKGVDGSDAIEIEVNPSVVSLQANENGTVSDYSTANTNIVVKQGNLYLSYETSSLPGTYNVTATGSGIVVGDVSASSQYDLDFGDETVHYTNFSQLEAGSGSVDYNFYVYPYSLTNGVAGVEETYTKKQLFSKSNDGTAARSVSLSTTTEVVNFDGDGVVTSPLGSIFLEATAFNVTASQTYYQFFRDGFAYSLVGTDPTFEIGSGDATSPGETATWQVQIRDGASTSPIVATSEVTIAGIKAGADNYQVFLTNPSPSVGVEVDGTTTLDTTGTQITALKGTTQLTHVSTYSEETLNLIGDPIGTIGEFSSSLYYVPSFITQPNIPNGNPASVDPITAWTLPQDNKSATIVYKVDIENGRATYFLSQSLSTVFEGATGPGIVVRGEWTGSVDYLFSLEQKRRDAIIYKYDNGGEQETHYFATTNELNDYKRLPYTASVGITDEPEYDGSQEQGDVDTFGWEYLGQQDMFVAAKIAIFEESFVENTINVGIPPDGNPNANIAIVGGSDEPYIAIGQTGTQGFAQPGVFIGMTNDGGPNGTSGTMGILSLKSTPAAGEYKSLEWDGETLTIRGSIRQTAAGVVEPSLRGTWADGIDYNPEDLVQYVGETWSSNTSHTSNISGDSTDGPPGTGPWTIAAGAGKNISLSADSYVIQYDEFGLNPTPSSTITLIASSSNFVDAYYKFTGGGAVFTDETSFTDGLTANTDTATLNVPTSYFSTPLTIKVAVSEGDQIEKLSDTITITALKSGADSTPQYMITPLTGTQIKNSSGNIELQVQESSINGLSDVNSGDIKIYKNDSSLLNASMSGVTGDAYNPTLDSDAITGTLNLQLRDASDNVLDSITLVDVSDGLGGGSFLSPNLKSTRNPGYGIYNPTFLSATASFFDTSGTEYQKQVRITPSLSSGVDYMAVGAASGDSEITITANDGDGNTITLGGSSVATKDTVLVATFTDPATSQTTTINETFYIVSDGADGLSAITVINTNQSHTVPASSDGVVSSYSNSGTDISVYEGTGSLSYDGVGNSPGNWTITSNVLPLDAIIVGSITDNGDDITIGDHSSMDNAESIANITYTISGQRINGDSFTSNTTQTITKAKEGVKAKTIRLSADSQTFRIAKDGTVTPSTITFTANRQNLTNTTTFTTNPSPLTIGEPATDVATLTYNNFSQGGAQTAVTITATADGLSDEITVVEVVEGSDAITVVLSNESHTFAADNSGNIASFAGSGTTISVFEGATPLNHDNGGVGGFDITTTTTNIVVGTITDSGNNAVVGDHSNMTADSASIEYEIDITKLDGTNILLYKTQSFSKSKAGTDGTPGAPGASGAGITYRGEWANDAGVTYNSSDARKDVVKFNGDFYIADYDGGDTFAGNITPPNATYWATFGAQFESVATDILFAEDVYANRTINIGTGESGNPVIALNADSSSGYANPFISIGQTTQGFESDGIFMGFDEGTASLSLTGENVKTNIGGWQVDTSGLFYETEYSIGDSIEADFYFTSSILNSSLSQWLYYGGGFYGINDYYSMGSEFGFPPAVFDVYTRTPDPFGSGSQLIAYGQITTTHIINGRGNTNSQELAVFTLEGPALYADSSSVDYLTYLTSSYDLSAGGPGTTKAEIVWADGADYIQAFEYGTSRTVALSWNTISETGSFTNDNFFGPPDFAPNTNAYVYATNVDIGPYVSESIAIKLSNQDIYDPGTDSQIKTESPNTFGRDLILSSYDQNPAANQFILYTIHRSGVQMLASSVRTVKAGSLTDAVITGDAIRLSTSGSTADSNKPYISIGQPTIGYNTRGVFMGFPSGSDTPQFSLRSLSGNYLRYNGDTIAFSGDLSGGTIEGTSIVGGSISVPGIGSEALFSVDVNGNVSASNANMSGIINANSGRIGDWIIDDETKSLRDENSEIIFEPNLPELQFFTGSEKKVIIGPQPTLSETDGASSTTITFTNLASAQPDTSVSITNTTATIPYLSSYSVGDNSNSAAISVSQGDIQIGLDLPAMTINPPTANISQITSYPNYSPSFDGQIHGNSLGPVPIKLRAYLYLEVVDTNNSNAVIGRKLVAQTSEAVSAYAGLGNYYVGSYFDDGNGGGGFPSYYSVVGDTEITLSDGSTILAKDIKIGQKILAWNWNDKIDNHSGVDKFDEFTISDVKTRKTSEIYKITVGDNIVEVSDSHGFWLDGNTQIKATELIAGESKIYVKDGDSISLQLVDRVDIIEGADVYTLSVPGVYNYISNGIISHNYVSSTWEYIPTSQGGVSAVNGTFAGASGQTVSIPISSASTAAKLRYSVRVSSAAGLQRNTNSSGTSTNIYTSATAAYNNTATSAISTTGYLQPMTLDTSLNFQLAANFVEIKAGGVQIVSSADSYVRMKRREPSSSNPELFKLTGGTAYFDVTDGGPGISAIVSTGNIIPGVNNLYDLGNSSFRWDDVFATNGTINTSDENQKENIVTSDLGLDFINALNPVSYKFISGSRTHYGLGAQSVETTLESFEKDSIDFAGLITGSSYGLRYHEFISPMIKAIQELTDKVTQLEAQISGSIS